MEYSIDLSGSNGVKLRGAFADVVAACRRIGGRVKRAGAVTRIAAGATGSTRTKEESMAIILADKRPDISMSI